MSQRVSTSGRSFRPAPGSYRAACRHLAVVGEERLLRQLPIDRLGDAEVDDFGDRHAVVERDHHIGGLEVAMDDPLLMGMLDRVADLDEQPGRSRVVSRFWSQ